MKGSPSASCTNSCAACMRQGARRERVSRCAFALAGRPTRLHGRRAEGLGDDSGRGGAQRERGGGDLRARARGAATHFSLQPYKRRLGPACARGPRMASGAERRGPGQRAATAALASRGNRRPDPRPRPQPRDKGSARQCEAGPQRRRRRHARHATQRRCCAAGGRREAAHVAKRTLAGRDFREARTTGVARKAAPRLAALRAGSTGSGFSASMEAITECGRAKV